MRSRSYLFLFLVLGLSVLSGVLYRLRPYNLGLDVRGGVRFVYEVDQKDLRNKSIEEIAPKVQTILLRRVSASLGVVEGNVARKPPNQFIVELPGFTDEAQAREALGRAASIKFYHAKNVTTEKAQYRPYVAIDGDSNREEPEVWFMRNGGQGDPIKPGTPEYLRVLAGWGDPILEGDDLDRAVPDGAGGKVIPKMLFSGKGSAKIEQWSRRYLNTGEKISAVLDNVVLNCVSVHPDTILHDNAVIQGDFSQDYVKKFCDMLNSGSLPVTLNVASSEKVDPTIGKFALDQMVRAGAIAFGVIALFMIAYYAFPGIIAVVALALYVLFTLTTLKMIGATFSLAAIAGFVLSVGMAVDANILVFERFKEEMKSGKTLDKAIDLGFRRALPAIVDSNACTILTSLVLAQLGSGPVKGFATTLIIGVAISLFTAITITRSLLMFFVGSGIVSNPKAYAVDRNWFGNIEERASHKPIRVVETSKLWFGISLLTILVFVPFAFMGGFKMNVEFRGGYETNLSLTRVNKTRDEIQNGLNAAGFEGANVKFGESTLGRVAIISVPQGKANGAPDEVAKQVAAAAGFTPADIGSASFVGPSIQKEMINNAILGLLLSAALIVVYLAFRFGFAVGNFLLGLRFGFSAILALIHDVFVVVGVTAFAGYVEHWEISSLFITSMLTVIGFSVHDTIVIFDRIRENLRKPEGNETFDHLVDRSITQSFARSINTSMTVVITLLILFVFGSATPDLKLFCVTMLAGIISGTYSSIFNASPILYLWDRMVGKSRGEEATLVAAARREAAADRVIAGPTVVAQPAVAGSDGRSYGQVRRRASSAPKKIEIEEP